MVQFVFQSQLHREIGDGRMSQRNCLDSKEKRSQNTDITNSEVQSGVQR